MYKRQILALTPKAACEPLAKLLKSAIANAENNFNMDKKNLYVAECFVCPGPCLLYTSLDRAEEGVMTPFHKSQVKTLRDGRIAVEKSECGGYYSSRFFSSSASDFSTAMRLSLIHI